MNELLKLGQRLQKCADYVPIGAKFLDIGTDHGYLPIWLLQNKKIISAVAADINKEPLASAVQNAKKYNIEIKTVLSNGFENIEKTDFNCVCIAGMGGELIANIIENGKILIDENDCLILQAMTKASKLREYLFENGFSIESEEAVFHKGKIYSVMKVCKKTAEKPCFYMGKIKSGAVYSKEYANAVVHDLENKLKGLTGENQEAVKQKIEQIESVYLNDK